MKIDKWILEILKILGKNYSESEFNKFEPRLKSPKNRFQSSPDLNIETLDTILSGSNHIWAATLI